MQYKGTLRYIDIGSGGWKLECENGELYALDGSIPAELKNKKVLITAKPTQSMGFLMIGPTIVVESIVAL